MQHDLLSAQARLEAELSQMDESRREIVRLREALFEARLLSSTKNVVERELRDRLSSTAPIVACMLRTFADMQQELDGIKKEGLAEALAEMDEKRMLYAQCEFLQTQLRRAGALELDMARQARHESKEMYFRTL